MAQANSDRIVSEMKAIKDTYMQQNPVVIDREVDLVFNRVLLDLFKFNFQCEIGNARLIKRSKKYAYLFYDGGASV